MRPFKMLWSHASAPLPRAHHRRRHRPAHLQRRVRSPTLMRQKPPSMVLDGIGSRLAKWLNVVVHAEQVRGIEASLHLP